jgi:hypothetical protein
MNTEQIKYVSMLFLSAEGSVAEWKGVDPK